MNDTSILDEPCVETIRTLAMDAIQKANSGHADMPSQPSDVGQRVR